MPLLSKTISTAITMHSFLMGSLKGAWEGQSSRITAGGGHEECRSQKPTSVNAKASAAELMATLRPTPPPEGPFWPTNRRSTIDRGYDSLTDCFEEALGIEEDEEVFHLELEDDDEDPKEDAVVTRDVLLAAGTIHDSSEEDEGLSCQVAETNPDEASSIRRPTLDWNSAVVQMSPGTSSDEDDLNHKRQMTPHPSSHLSPIMTSSSGHIEMTPSSGVEMKPAKPRARSDSRRSEEDNSSYKPEDLGVYALDIIRWKLELEQKHCLHKQQPPLSTSHASTASTQESNSIFAPKVQTEITYEMRRTLLEWLVAVNHQFKFTLETWCLTVNIMDRFLALQPIHTDCLQLVGLTSFFIAAKIEEVDPPETSELVSLCAFSYKPKQFLWMEYIILYRLKFELSTPTAGFFLSHLVEATAADGGREGRVRAANWPWETTRALVESAMCAEKRCAFTSEGSIKPSELAARIYEFVCRNYDMTCMVDGSSEDKSASANNLYQMLHIELQTT